jgi:hypothetical protein
MVLRKNSKSMIALALVFLTLVSLLSITLVNASENVTLSLVASTNIDLTYPATLPIDSTFTVNVNVNDVTNLYGDVIGLSWPTAIVHVTKVEAGAFLKSAGGATFSPPTTIDNSGPVGSLPSLFNDVAMDNNNPSGSGTLCTVTFKVVGYGSGSISITSARLVSDSAGTNIPIATTLPLSIPLNNPTPPPYGPTAAFTISASPGTVSGNFIIIPNTAFSTDIIFDASASSAGFDGSQYVPVTDYSWAIHSVNGQFADVEVTSPTVTVPSVSVDILQISLEVTAHLDNPPIGYVETSQVSCIYTVVQQESTGIDVYTNQGGQGPNVRSGPFGPQQQVDAFAYVFSNGAPVAQKDVVFVAYTNAGVEFAYVGARTDGNGIASVNLRLPTSDINLDSGFGSNWTIIAVVDISEDVYLDMVQFEFNYLANILGVEATAGTIFRGSGSVSIEVNTTTLAGAVISSDAIVTITVVDIHNVPVAAATADFDSTVSVLLPIPNYAFTGAASVYVNLINNQTTMMGTPYCPQNGAVVVFDVNGLFVSSTQNQPAQFLITFASTPGATASPTPTATASPTPTATASPTPTATALLPQLLLLLHPNCYCISDPNCYCISNSYSAPTSTATPTATPTPTATASPTPTPTPTATASPTPTPTALRPQLLLHLRLQLQLLLLLRLQLQLLPLPQLHTISTLEVHLRGMMALLAQIHLGIEELVRVSQVQIVRCLRRISSIITTEVTGVSVQMTVHSPQTAYKFQMLTL